jgi:putative PIN family toxin of toxin-antitoxin system
VRAVLDTNVLVSAALSSTGSPARLIRAVAEGAFELVASPALIDELEQVLARPRIRQRLSADETVSLLATVRRLATVVADPGRSRVPSPDPDDQYLIALAEHERVALVTGDMGLLSLSGQIPVYSPADFLQLLAPGPDA